MSATGRNRKSKSKVDLVTIDDDDSSTVTAVPPSEAASVKVEEAEEQAEEAQEPVPQPEEPPLPTDVAELQKEVTKLQKQFKRACLTARQAELRAEHAEKLLDDKRELAQNRAAAEESELEGRYAALQKQLDKTRQRADNAFALKVDAARERDELRAQVADLKIATDRQVRELREKYAGLEEGESDLARENANLKRDLEEANDKKDEVTRKLSSLRDELNEANSSKVELARENSSLKRDLEEANSRNGDSAADSADLALAASLRADLEASRRREEAANDAKAALARENASLMANIDQLKEAAGAAGDGIENAVIIGKLRKENADLKDEIEQLRRNTANASSNDEPTRESALLTAGIDRFKNFFATDDAIEKQRLTRENADLKEEIAELRRSAANGANNDELARENAALKAENEQLRRSIDEGAGKDDLAREHAALKKELGMERQKSDKAITEKIEGTVENDLLKREIAQLKEREEQRVARAAASSQGGAEESDLAEENAALKEELAKLKGEAHCSDSYLSLENKSLKEQLTSAKEQAAAANVQQSDIVRERDALKVKVDGLERERRELTERNGTLLDALAVVRNLRPAQEETSNLANQVQALKAKVEFERLATEKLRASNDELELRLEQAEGRLKRRTSQEVVLSDPRLQGRRSNSVEKQRQLISPSLEKRARLDDGGGVQQLLQLQQPRDLPQPTTHHSQPLQQQQPRDPLNPYPMQQHSQSQPLQPLHLQQSPGLQQPLNSLQPYSMQQQQQLMQLMQHLNQSPQLQQQVQQSPQPRMQQLQQPRDSLQPYPMQQHHQSPQLQQVQPSPPPLQLQPQNYQQSVLPDVQQPQLSQPPLQPPPWPMVDITQSAESEQETQFDVVGDLTNLYHLVQPGSRDAIAIEAAAAHVRTVIAKQSNALFSGSHFLPSQGESAHCELCKVKLENLSIITHFCSQEHVDKMLVSGACVSLPALMYWVRKMTPAKK